MAELLETRPAPAPALPACRSEPGRLSWQGQLGLAHLALAHNFKWTALLLITIPAQVVTIAGERNKTTALAGVLVVGALVAAVTQIVGGGLSDRATFRWGRRRPYILAGTLIGCVGLYLMSQARSIPMLAAAFLLLQFGFNLGQAAYAALLPDRVPREQRGAVSGLLGLMATLGIIGAALVGGRVVKEGSYASFHAIYFITIVVQLAFTISTVLVLREEPAGDVEAFRLGAFLRQMWIDPRRNPDFAWVFITRFLVMMGYYTLLDFLFYYVRDQLGPRHASADVSLITEAVTLAAAVTIFFSGRLSDRVGRKPLVYASGVFMALVSLTFIVTHTLIVAVVVGAFWGLGWGAYQSVDYALATDVLPRPAGENDIDSFARFMGIWSLAVTVPQVLSPSIGPLIDAFNGLGARHHVHDAGYTFMFGAIFVYFILGAVLIRFVRSAK